MRIALPASGAIHLGLLALAILYLSNPEPIEGSGAAAVSVDIVSFESVSSENATQADAAEELVSAGAESLSPVPAEAVEVTEAVEVSEVIEPSEVQSIEPSPTEPLEIEIAEEPPAEVDAETPIELAEPVADAVEGVEPLEAAEAEAVETIEPLTETTPALVAETTEALPSETVLASSGEAVEMVAAIEPVAAQAVLEPVSESELKIAPVPQVLTRPRTSTPTYPERQQTPPRQQTAQNPPPSASSGAGGADEADSAASAASAASVARQSVQEGDAANEQYQSSVFAKIRQAHRQPRGARFEGRVVVSFLISGSGAESSIRIARSTGDAAMDQAAIDTINRAAPFPPIPASVGASSLNFAIPVDFDR